MFDTELHLFIFRRQGVTVRLASADRDIEAGGHTYLAAQIERDAIKQTAERAKDKMKIRVAYLLTPVQPYDGWPATQALGDWWRPHIPSDPISVICMTHTYGSAEPPKVEWMGWAIQPAYTDTQLELSCDPNPPHGNAVNQGPKWQRACFKAAYSTGPRGCNLVEDDFKTLGECGPTSHGVVLAVPEFIDTPFSLQGGNLYWTRADGIQEDRPIMSHNQATGEVHVLWGGVELGAGTLVAGVPNCPGNWAACAARRPDPQNHYGGALYKPVRDPIVEGVPMSWG